MSILINKDTKLIVQGITGRDGSFHASKMKEYGTNVVGGTSPGKAGQEVCGIPVFNTVKDAVAATGANTSIIFVPAQFAKDAMLEAIENSDLKTAAAIQRKFIPKVNALFSVPSPAPVKAVLNHLGFEVGPLRLPLVACTSEEAKRIIKVVLEEDVEATRETVTGVVRPDY